MTLPKDEKREELSSKTHFRSEKSRKSADEVFRYEDSGLMERHGYIPYWLWIVVVALIVWGVYYLIENWHAPLN